MKLVAEEGRWLSWHSMCLGTAVHSPAKQVFRVVPQIEGLALALVRRCPVAAAVVLLILQVQARTRPPALSCGQGCSWACLMWEHQDVKELLWLMSVHGCPAGRIWAPCWARLSGCSVRLHPRKGCLPAGRLHNVQGAEVPHVIILPKAADVQLAYLQDVHRVKVGHIFPAFTLARTWGASGVSATDTRSSYSITRLWHWSGYCRVTIVLTKPTPHDEKRGGVFWRRDGLGRLQYSAGPFTG